MKDQFVVPFFRAAYAEAFASSMAGLIFFVQAFGDLVNFHPHAYVLATDGTYLPEGSFVALPPVPEARLVEGFRCRVHDFLVEKRAI